MFERFTDRARRVIVLAREDASRLGHDHIGPEHILLGLLRTDRGTALLTLESLGISSDDVRQQVEEIVGHGDHEEAGHIPFTPQAKKVLEYSLREGMELDHGYIGTEHILLGLLREGDGVPAQVLTGMGVDQAGTRREVLRLLAERRAAHPVAPGGVRSAAVARRLDDIVTRLESIEVKLDAIAAKLGMAPDEPGPAAS